MKLNGTARGLLIIAGVSAAIVVLQLWVSLALLVLAARIAFFCVMAFVVYLAWRANREGISMWPRRAQWVFYGAAAVAVAAVAVYWYGGAHGMQMIAFVATLALCGVAMVRTWREQHTYA
jgi:hypothetical protein